MSERAQAAVFAALIAAVALALLVAAAGRPGPTAVAAAVLICAAAAAIRTARAEQRSAGERLDVIALGWALALPPAILLFGCCAALGLFVLAFVRVRGGRSWPVAALCGLLAALPVYVLAQTMLRDDLVTGGLLWSAL